MSATAKPYLLFTSKGCGSVLVEALLELTGETYEREEHAFETLGPKNSRIARYNPLGQVPTLVLPDGSVMTQSAAIAIYLADHTPTSRLAPAIDHPDRAQFLRWLIFLVADLYATYYYADKPEQFVSGEKPAAELKESIGEHRKRLWKIVEANARGTPWFLGQQFCALDVFIAAMSRWTPRREWLTDHCPKLAAIAVAADQKPELKAVWGRNF